MPKHFLTLLDLGRDDLLRVLARAKELKALRGTPAHPRPLEGKSVAIVLEKASTRTRVSFEVGVFELGGQPVTLLAKDTQLGRGEPIEDTARMLSRFVHAIVFRTFGHQKVQTLAKHSRVPVINGLCDRFHPCQLLADLQTVQEALGTEDLRDVPVAWIGDGNNVSHSWILAAALLGLDLRLACPDGFFPEAAVLEMAARAAREVGIDPQIRVVRDPREAAEGARVVTTDVWASMGQESEAVARARVFEGYQVDAALMERAARDAIFLHCLPAHRGEEVSADVIDGPASRVWDEAENRLHAQKALLEHLVR
ncbi:ornithine carbamoyltransferase [Sandaracinus amylolyticus]|uniref:ornithine carbamoyltransferase n=1 Tax=Sandaracinus amylolyticus TaxID=927083 RepID=UPI001F163F7E|nr:ornithine carbamoyltransferase [Sandaracinus amylolyticus]UJR78250.1 Ornithine carbamoyltransferase [Sandaracinus amylolyticus]